MPPSPRLQLLATTPAHRPNRATPPNAPTALALTASHTLPTPLHASRVQTRPCRTRHAPPHVAPTIARRRPTATGGPRSTALAPASPLMNMIPRETTAGSKAGAPCSFTPTHLPSHLLPPPSPRPYSPRPYHTPLPPPLPTLRTLHSAPTSPSTPFAGSFCTLFCLACRCPLRCPWCCCPPLVPPLPPPHTGAPIGPPHHRRHPPDRSQWQAP